MQNREEKLRVLIRRLEELSYHIAEQEERNIDILKKIVSEQGNTDLRNVSLSLAECHVIDCIGSNEKFNSTAIARELNITKGGISKITAKLVKKGMIETYRLETNRKEVYFRLMPVGERVYEIHRTLHKNAVSSIEKALGAYSQQDMELASAMLHDITAAFIQDGNTGT